MATCSTPKPSLAVITYRRSTNRLSRLTTEKTAQQLWTVSKRGLRTLSVHACLLGNLEGKECDGFRVQRIDKCRVLQKLNDDVCLWVTVGATFLCFCTLTILLCVVCYFLFLAC